MAMAVCQVLRSRAKCPCRCLSTQLPTWQPRIEGVLPIYARTLDKREFVLLYYRASSQKFWGLFFCPHDLLRASALAEALYLWIRPGKGCLISHSLVQGLCLGSMPGSFPVILSHIEYHYARIVIAIHPRAWREALGIGHNLVIKIRRGPTGFHCCSPVLIEYVRHKRI